MKEIWTRRRSLVQEGTSSPNNLSSKSFWLTFVVHSWIRRRWWRMGRRRDKMNLHAFYACFYRSTTRSIKIIPCSTGRYAGHAWATRSGRCVWTTDHHANVVIKTTIFIIKTFSHEFVLLFLIFSWSSVLIILRQYDIYFGTSVLVKITEEIR